VAPFVVRKLANPVEKWNFMGTWERVYGPSEIVGKDPRPIWQSLAPTRDVIEHGLSNQTFLVAESPTVFDFAIHGDFHAAVYAGVAWPRRYPML
jgi:hypothetical protein